MNLFNFALFQVGWLAAVWGAAQGMLWLGPVAALVMIAIQLRLVRNRRFELAYIGCVTLVGTLVDSALHGASLIEYPTSGAWGLALVPPWISSLWAMFATLPRFSLRWLAPYPVAAAVCAAVGGPLSFWAGTRFGPIAPGTAPGTPLATYAALAIEYAVLTPLMLMAARGAVTAPGGRVEGSPS